MIQSETFEDRNHMRYPAANLQGKAARSPRSKEGQDGGVADAERGHLQDFITVDGLVMKHVRNSCSKSYP